jgi:hypothetical protein
MVYPEQQKIFLGGQNLDEVDVAHLQDISSWKRTIVSYKSKLDNCMIAPSDLE